MSTAPHFTARLPAKRVAADCLFFDSDGRILLVEPTYKVTWDLPGGIVETDESPRQAARRELREEMGLDRKPGSLLVLDQSTHSRILAAVAARHRSNCSYLENGESFEA